MQQERLFEPTTERNHLDELSLTLMSLAEAFHSRGTALGTHIEVQTAGRTKPSDDAVKAIQNSVDALGIIKNLLLWAGTDTYVGHNIFEYMEEKLKAAGFQPHELTTDEIRKKPIPTDGVKGTYKAARNRQRPEIFVTENVTYSNGERVRNTDLARTFYHETGHHIDSLFSRISQSEEFLEAYAKDIERIQDRIERAITMTESPTEILFGGNIENTIYKYSYFLPKPLGDHADVNKAAKEAFAELFDFCLNPDEEAGIEMEELLPHSCEFTVRVLEALKQEIGFTWEEYLKASVPKQVRVSTSSCLREEEPKIFTELAA